MFCVDFWLLADELIAKNLQSNSMFCAAVSSDATVSISWCIALLNLAKSSQVTANKFGFVLKPSAEVIFLRAASMALISLFASMYHWSLSMSAYFMDVIFSPSLPTFWEMTEVTFREIISGASSRVRKSITNWEHESVGFIKIKSRKLEF